MAVFNAVFPILPGKVEAARALARDTLGPRRAQFEDAARRVDVTRQTWSIQHNPDGSAFSVVWIESPDPEKVLLDSATDESEYGVWFRERVREVNGIELDPSQPLAGLCEATLDWQA